MFVPQLFLHLGRWYPTEGGGEYDYPERNKVGNLNYPSFKLLGNMITLPPFKVGN